MKRTILKAILTCACLAPGVSAPAQSIVMEPVASARIIMVRLYVSDLERSEKFYKEVFETEVETKIGQNVRILTFPSGARPGIMMIKSAQVQTVKSSFLIQVPDLESVLTRAVANGGTVQPQQFARMVQGTPARSRHLQDPDGNDVEAMQFGSSK